MRWTSVRGKVFSVDSGLTPGGGENILFGEVQGHFEKAREVEFFGG